jgi:putative ABC transport system permease protein
MAEQLRAIPGLADVEALRRTRVMVRGSPVGLAAADTGGLRKWAGLPAVDGNSQEMIRLTAAGNGILASESFVILHRYKLGDIVDIPSPGGMLRLPIVGIIKDYFDQTGTIFLDRRVYIQFWNDRSISFFGVYLQPGASEAEVKGLILKRFSGNRRIFVLSNRDLRNMVLMLTEQFSKISYVPISVAILVAVLGIVNTLAVSITDRRQEFGVLQAIGGSRHQIRSAVWIEALIVGNIGLFLGLVLGSVELYYALETSVRDIGGTGLPYEYPYKIALALLPIILAAAFVAAISPAESVVRDRLAEALQYE